MHRIDTHSLFGGRKLVLFSVPGAFTPTCSERHLPGFVQHFDDVPGERGIDVACMAVNDAFVMQAWGQSQGVPQGMKMLADGNADFTRALGLELDASGYGMGMRSKRFALYAEDERREAACGSKRRASSGCRRRKTCWRTCRPERGPRRGGTSPRGRQDQKAQAVPGTAVGQRGELVPARLCEFAQQWPRAFGFADPAAIQQPLHSGGGAQRA